MEKVRVLDKKAVITALTEGKKLAHELKRQLHPTTTSRETCGVLVESILSSYENAITLLALIGNGGSSQNAAVKLVAPPNSVEGTPRSKGIDQNCRKRKALPRWSEQVRVCSGIGSEGQVDDGYSWRKYGQKDILGAAHPRAYYRCTHRNTQGCLALKQVQQTDEDPRLYEVTYRGNHSCRQEKLKQNKEIKDEEMLRYESSLVKIDSKEEHTHSFSFPSTPIDYEDVEPHFFSDATNNFITTTYSPSFTSDSYFSLSSCPLNDFGIEQHLDSDFGEIISNPAQILDLPLRDLDVSMDGMDFGCFLLEGPESF